jgi:signal transduction histidine kinase
MGPQVGSGRHNARSIASKLPIRKASGLHGRKTYRQLILSAIGWKISAMAIAILLLAPGAMGASSKNVLILHEGSRLLPYQVLMARVLQKDLASNAKMHVEVFEEYLDNWRLDLDIPRSANALEAKYSGKKFDAVLADGAGALQLLLDHPPDFLQGTPVVFVSVADFNLPPKLPANITGIATHVDYAGTVRLAQALQPDLQHVYYIDDEPLTRNVKNEMFQNEFRSLLEQLDISFWEQDDVGTLLRKVGNLPPHSAVLFDSYFTDPSGQTYVPAQVAALVAVSANAPVYAPYQTMLGTGVVGGVAVNFEAIGREAARIILAVLHGAKISGFPVEKSRNDIMIDWRAFQRFRLEKKQLPSTATVLYREPTMWARYGWYFAGGALVIVFQLILIFKLAIEGKKRKESEKSARELAGRLIHAQEEERRRIAGELHDDVSQRLALICLQVDTMRGSPPVSQELLTQELSVLYDEIDLISSDIHQFSHELHPSILEKLGLISALRRFCKEFSLHRKIAVNMTANGDEPALHRDTALALFRVGQECLMNVAKHSGAVSCDVSLNYAHDRVTLQIEDHGSGFEMGSLREKAGLGIESMCERLRSVGGKLRIDSAPLRGTKVRAEAPIVLTETDGPHIEFDKALEEHPNVPAA